MHAAAVLLVNNYRDRAHDATTGRRTLTVVLSAAGAIRLYAGLVLAPFALAGVLVPSPAARGMRCRSWRCPGRWRLWQALAQTPSGPAQNALLFRTVMLEVAFGMLLAAGALLAGRIDREHPRPVRWRPAGPSRRAEVAYNCSGLPYPVSSRYPFPTSRPPCCARTAPSQ